MRLLLQRGCWNLVGLKDSFWNEINKILHVVGDSSDFDSPSGFGTNRLDLLTREDRIFVCERGIRLWWLCLDLDRSLHYPLCVPRASIEKGIPSHVLIEIGILLEPF